MYSLPLSMGSMILQGMKPTLSKAQRASDIQGKNRSTCPRDSDITATTLLVISNIPPPLYATRSPCVFTSSPSSFSRLTEPMAIASSSEMRPPALIAAQASSKRWFRPSHASSIPKPTVTLYFRSVVKAVSLLNGSPGSLQIS